MSTGIYVKYIPGANRGWEWRGGGEEEGGESSMPLTAVYGGAAAKKFFACKQRGTRKSFRDSSPHRKYFYDGYVSLTRMRAERLRYDIVAGLNE